MRKILIKHVTTEISFKNLKDAWTQLLVKSPSNNIFLSWEWLYAWWETYGKTKKLWIITVWAEEELIGIAPLMLDKRGKGLFKLRVLCNIGTPGVDISGFIFKEEEKQVVKALFDDLIEHKKEWDVLELNEFFQESTEITEFRHSFSFAQFAILEETEIHYYVKLREDWDSYFSSLSGKFRHNLRRALRLAKESGNISFEHYSGENANWEIFKKVAEVNRHSNHPRLYDSAEEQSFIKYLIDLMTDHKWLSVYILYINTKPVAYEYGFYTMGRFLAWRAGYDTRINPSISIGKLLSMMILENCTGCGYVEIDFLRGTEQYKQEWQPKNREFVNVRVFNIKTILAFFAYQWLKTYKPLFKRFTKKWQ